MTVTCYPMNRFKRLQSQAVKTPSYITPSRKTKASFSACLEGSDVLDLEFKLPA